MAEDDDLFLSVNSDAVDVSVRTKSDAVAGILSDYGIAADEACAIGDSANDLPFLAYPGLLSIGVPSNAQPRVRAFVEAAKAGFISSKPGPAGFEEFYDHCTRLQARIVISDRDGVLRWKNTQEEHQSVARLFREMGQNGRPYIILLTGSSFDQNRRFIEEFSLGDALRKNAAAPEAFHIYAENGAVRINAVTLDHDISKNGEGAERFVTTVLRDAVIQRISTDVLPKHGLSLAQDDRALPGSVYLPPKETMLTINIPRTDAEGRPFRDDPRSNSFRADIANAIARVMEEHHVSFERI